MTDKEIIIDGVDINNVRNLLFAGQRSSITTSTLEKIIDLLEEKTQECEELKEDYKELEQRHNEAYQDFKRLKQEREKLKVIIENSELCKFVLSGCEINFPIIQKYEEVLNKIEDYTRALYIILPHQQLKDEGNDSEKLIQMILNTINEVKE